MATEAQREANTRSSYESEPASEQLGVADRKPDRPEIAHVVNEQRKPKYRGPDRRKPSLKSFIYGAFNPRRRRIRRAEDRESAFIDWYPTHLLVAAALIMSLSVVDGIFTVHLMSAGAVELNPLMDLFVHNSPMTFALVKVFLTGVGVISLVIVSQARLLRKWPMVWIIYALLFSYATLVTYSYRLIQATA